MKQNFSPNVKRNTVVEHLKTTKGVFELHNTSKGSIFISSLKQTETPTDYVTEIQVNGKKIESTFSKETDEIIDIVFQNITKNRRVQIGSETVIVLIKPVVGMGASTGYNGDSYPWTIHAVSSNLKSVWASEDEHKVIGGPYEYGAEIPYEYSNKNENDPNKWTEFILRKNGRYVKKGVSMNSALFSELYLGHRSYRQNPEF